MIENIVAASFCMAIAFFAGYSTMHARFTKARKRIIRLECEKLADHATILALQKEYADREPLCREERTFAGNPGKKRVA